MIKFDRISRFSIPWPISVKIGDFRDFPQKGGGTPKNPKKPFTSSIFDVFGVFTHENDHFSLYPRIPLSTFEFLKDFWGYPP